ncbi:MAG: MBL fold metallo-hydrolase [Geminicoccaceae bacterium]|nr:MAG: MBL fold metallo-hydrolase [Geminicoccaceae bacterium]
MTNNPLRFGRREAFGVGAGALLSPLSIGAAQAATPRLGPARPSFYRFQLGAFEVTTLLDGYVHTADPHQIFGENQDPAAVAALAEANFLPADRLENSFTPVLVNTGSELVLFDTGNPAARQPTAGNLLSAMAAAGYSADQVDVVVLTHFHGDHIGGLMDGEQPRFPRAHYVANAREYDWWTADARLGTAAEGGAENVRANVVPLAEKMSFVEDGQDVVAGITAVAAYGHSPGHTAFHLESQGRRLLLWADTANHFVLSVQRPEWHVRFDMDKDAAIATRKRLFDMAATERLPVAGYHMPFPALGFVDRQGSDYRFVRASYQFNL